MVKDTIQFVLLHKRAALKKYAGVAELADAPDLGSGGRPCRFKSCHPHFFVPKNSILLCLYHNFPILANKKDSAKQNLASMHPSESFPMIKKRTYIQMNTDSII